MSRFRTRLSGGYKQYNSGKGWTYTHRTVAAKKMGGSIRSGLHVHHMDGNKLNNKRDNLQVMKRSDHSKLHAKKRRNIFIQHNHY